jgi:hypothetical protein
MKPLSFMRPLLLLLILTAAYTAPVQAQQTKNVGVRPFSEVSVSAGIELLITQGTVEKARIVAREDLIDEVLIEQQGDHLRIGWRENDNYSNKFKNKSAKVYVSYKTLNDISASSGSSLTTENELKTGKLEIRASSGASINAKIVCTDLELHTSSGASADISGRATNLDVSTSSGASIDAGDLLTDYAKASASSGGGVKINVAKGLQASASSGGSVRYKGDAALRNTSPRNGGIRHIN